MNMDSHNESKEETPIINHQPPARSKDEWTIWNVIEKTKDMIVTDGDGIVQNTEQTGGESPLVCQSHESQTLVFCFALDPTRRFFISSCYRVSLWIHSFQMSNTLQSRCLGL